MSMRTARSTKLGPLMQIGAGGNVNTTAIDAATEKLAFRYTPSTTSPITEIDLYFNITGTVTGINFIIQVESNSSDAPSGTLLGAATSAFAGPATDGWIGLKALVTNTGNLTVNTPVWIVLAVSSGTPDVSNYVQILGKNLDSIYSTYMLQRHYNGTNWTTTATTSNIYGVVIKHLDGTYNGNVIQGSVVDVTATDIFGTNRHGFRLKSGAMIKIGGVLVNITVAGVPNDLVITVYEGATSKYSNTIPASTIISARWMPLFFSSPILLAANTNLYVVFSQSADGGSDTADYSLRNYDLPSAYIEAAYSADMRFVYGTGDNPTTYTVSSTELLLCLPILDDPAVDLDEAAGGGGMLVHSGMDGGMRG